MNIHLKYLKYILRHKFYVFQECHKRGITFRGIIHDFSKLRRDEWMGYSRFFYGPNPNAWMKGAFMDAWMKHCNRNDHHWQFWVAISDSGKVTPHEIPEKARLEMMADWVGTSKTLGKNGASDLRDWYNERRGTILLAPKTKRWIEEQLEEL